MTRDELKRELAGMLAAATDGDVPAPVALAGTAPLGVLGMTSLASLRLVDAVEARYGVELDPGDRQTLDSLDTLADHLLSHGGNAAPAVEPAP